MKLSELQTGEVGVIVKVLGHGGFRKRIVEMGFIKGKTVEVLLNAPLQDPVKYRIMDYEVSLRRQEASMIEIISAEEVRSLGKDLLTEDIFANNSGNDVKINASVVSVTDMNVISFGGNVKDSVDDINCDCGEPLSGNGLTREQWRDAAMKKRRKINVALVGNPNCGKTSLFNFASGAHERVGNYSGVTVDAKEGSAFFEGYEFCLVDLPGTYSLSAYSPEELYVRERIIDHTPDVVINVIDASNLERNLYLTTQLVDMNLRMVCALNMYDEFQKRGDRLNIDTLARLFGAPMIPTSFKTGEGLELLFHIIINIYEGVDFTDAEGNINEEVARELKKWHDSLPSDILPSDHDDDYASGLRPQNSVVRHIHVGHGQYLEKAIDMVQDVVKKNKDIRARYSTRYLAIKLLENDSEVQKVVAQLENYNEIEEELRRAKEYVQLEMKDDSETALMNAKYGFIHGALSEAEYKKGSNVDSYHLTHLMDYVITHRVLGFPIFLLLIFLMFQTTFALGQYPMDWIDSVFAWLGDWISETMVDGPLKDMIVDGIIGGVGAVIVFLPQILILYAFISFMEDSGYMARAAFIMDKLMHKMGLHGKSFIPLIMGFGCNVPAVMASRTIESRRSRLVTMMVTPLMSCSARLPIYIMITSTFFAPQYRSWIMISLYVVGVMLAVLVSRLLTRFVVPGEDTPFVMELPPYRFPTAKAIFRHTWEKGKQYLRKMGGIILVASIIVWALSYFPHSEGLTSSQQQEQSYLGQLGKAVEPLFRAQGFDWKLDVGLLTGVSAKEIVASTLGVIYASGDDANVSGDDVETLGEELAEDAILDSERYTSLYDKMSAGGITPLIAFCYLLFVLIYFPCIATIAAIKNETGSWRWALFAALYTTVLAWVVSAVVYQTGRFLGYN